MPRALRFILLLMPLLVVLATLGDTPFHHLSRGVLTGVVVPQPMPKLSFASFWSGEYQPKLEKWLEQELSFKPAMIRTDNSLNLLAFREISQHTRIPIILGERGTLFEMNYINNANAVSELKGDPPPKTNYTVEESAQRMGRAARAFRALGIDFMMLMYPSKAWIQQDRIPARFRLPGGAEKAEAGYRHLLALLRREGVLVIDGVEAFHELLERDPKFPAYVRGGTHWTMAGSCIVAQRVVEGLSARGSSKLRCKLGDASPPQGTDRDLADLINVWDNQRFLTAVPESFSSLSRPLEGGPPGAVFVGTSFSEILVAPLLQANAIRNVRRYEYYRHKDVRKVRWARELKGRSLVVFEQWQWSYLTVNLTDYLDDLLAHDPRFAAAYAEPDAAQQPAPEAPAEPAAEPTADPAAEP